MRSARCQRKVRGSIAPWRRTEKKRSRSFIKTHLYVQDEPGLNKETFTSSSYGQATPRLAEALFCRAGAAVAEKEERVMAATRAEAVRAMEDEETMVCFSEDLFED